MHDKVTAERTQLRTILVGADGSPGAGRALEWAAARAKESGAEVVAAHVLTYSTELRRDVTFDTMTTWRRRVQDQLHGPWTEPARAEGVLVRCILVEADSSAAGLLGVARRESADLIVLGVHGHGNLADRLFGSTSYVVTHRSPTPVVVIPPGW